MGHPHRQEGVLGSFAAPLAATTAAVLSPAGLGEGERGRPPPQQLHLSRHMEVKIIPGGDEAMRSRADIGSGSDDDRGRRSPPPNYKMDEAAAVPTPTTCASVTSLDDS